MRRLRDSKQGQHWGHRTRNSRPLAIRSTPRSCGVRGPRLRLPGAKLMRSLMISTQAAKGFRVLRFLEASSKSHKPTLVDRAVGDAPSGEAKWLGDSISESSKELCDPRHIWEATAEFLGQPKLFAMQLAGNGSKPKPPLQLGHSAIPHVAGHGFDR